MKECVLCGNSARLHCESDEANLCWDCDLKIHGANFLVAKHSRILLCHVCQNPTPWFASGRNFGSAVTVCDSCVGNRNNEPEVTAEESSEGEYGEEEEDEDYDDDETVEEEEVEDAENQVVPWSGDSSSISMSKPVASLDRCSEGVRVSGGFGLKRMRENQSFSSDDEIVCSSSLVGSGGSSNGDSSSMGSSRLLQKQPRLDEANQLASVEINGYISYLKRLQKHIIADDDDASATITGICKLSRDQSR